MPRLPTVAIRSQDGNRIIINESDFDPEQHERFDAAPQPKAQPEPTKEYGVENTSPGWWKVLDAYGDQVGPAYRSKNEAEEALEDLTRGD